MYCDKCGTEINFVPEFEPEVQNQIDETLLGLADELNKEERIKRERKEKNSLNAYHSDICTWIFHTDNGSKHNNTDNVIYYRSAHYGSSYLS